MATLGWRSIWAPPKGGEAATVPSMKYAQLVPLSALGFQFTMSFIMTEQLKITVFKNVLLGFLYRHTNRSAVPTWMKWWNYQLSNFFPSRPQLEAWQMILSTYPYGKISSQNQ